MTALATATWVAPPIWSVPTEWAGERAFVICGGESVNAQRHLIPKLRGRFVAVKHGVFIKPDADVLFFAGERPDVIAPPCLAAFRGQYAVVRGRGHQVFPETVKRLWRTTTHERWSDDPTMVAGFDAGTSSINLAMLFGATEIAIIGMDMGGGRWFNDEIQHYLPQPPESDFQRHMSVLPDLEADAKAKGVRIVNCSPISRVTCFERQPLESFL
jgi:hypothetical protein